MTTNSTLNILVLCATNATAKHGAENILPNINHIITTHFTHMHNAQHKFFYTGLRKKIKHELENSKCMSFVDTLIEKCKYTAGQFDIIITNNCPSGYAKAIFTDIFFETISYLLKNGGIFSYINFTNNSDTIDFKFSKKQKTYNYDEFNDKISKYALKHVAKYQIPVNQGNEIQQWHSIQKNISNTTYNNSVSSNTNTREIFYSLERKNNTATKESITLKTDPTKINILILCATDETASFNPTRLQANIDNLIKKYFTVPNAKTQPIQQLYYMGNMLTHNLQHNKCKSTVNNMIINCKYTPNMFDIILSEYYPTHTHMTVFSDVFFINVRHLLKVNGIISWKQSTTTKNYTFKVANNKQISQINYEHAAFYNMLSDKYHLIYDGLYNVTNNTVHEQWCIIKKEAQLISNNVAQMIHNVHIPSTQDLTNTIHFINYSNV